VPRWIPDEPGEEAGLLRELGISDAEDLFADIPRRIRLGRMGVGPSHDELQIVQTVDKILDRNRPYSKFAAFLGGRTPIRYPPAAVDAILSRSEFYTSYTPYQPEASQGMLQAMFEFQSLWVELTGLEVSNASMYDGATAAGEALLFCRRLHEGTCFLVPASQFWEERSVLENYAEGNGARFEEIPFDSKTGNLDLEAVRSAIRSKDVFGMLVDLPNGFGHLDEGIPELRPILGNVPLVVNADPLTLSVIEPPGDWGADAVVGEGQSFGLPPSFGGPLLGLFACRREHVRFSPGRIVGATRDAAGQRAFTLTLQTREQHIRRSRATSNICTNESLVALAFVTYASVIGPKGLAQLESRLSERARTLAGALAGIEGLTAPRFDAPFLTDFTIDVTLGSPTDFLDRLRRRKVLGGFPLQDPRPGRPASFAGLIRVGVSETIDEKQIQKYARAARAALAGGTRTA
jgi:glycine dehydrogenase subunit 1